MPPPVAGCGGEVHAVAAGLGGVAGLAAALLEPSEALEFVRVVEHSVGRGGDEIAL
jgi:hypothetical protein